MLNNNTSISEVRDLQTATKRLMTNKKIQAAGDFYLFDFANMFVKIGLNFENVRLNSKFSFYLNLEGLELTKYIANEIYSKFAKQGAGEQSSLPQNEQQKEFEIIPQNQITDVVQMILQFNSKNKDRETEGDFDIILVETKDYSYQITIAEKLSKEENELIQKGGVEKLWHMDDFLEIKPNYSGNRKAVYIFELKRNPFHEQNNKNMTENPKPPSGKIGSQFKDQFIKRAGQNNMLKIVSQIIKLVYAGVQYSVNGKKSKMEVTTTDILALRAKSQFQMSKTFKLEMQEHPVIVLYYVVNRGVTKEQFEEKFSFFKPFLRHLFKSHDAVMNVIGFSPVDYEEQLRQWKQKYQQKEKQMKKFQESYQHDIQQLRNSIKKLEIALQLKQQHASKIQNQERKTQETEVKTQQIRPPLKADTEEAIPKIQNLNNTMIIDQSIQNIKTKIQNEMQFLRDFRKRTQKL